MKAYNRFFIFSTLKSRVPLVLIHVKRVREIEGRVREFLRAKYMTTDGLPAYVFSIAEMTMNI